MTFTVTSRGSVGDTTARSDYTASVSTPGVNSLVLIGICFNSSTTPVQPSSVSGMGMVFSLVTSGISFNTIASPAHHLSLWRSASPSPTNSRVTAHFDLSGGGCVMLVSEVSGVDTSGTSGSASIGQSSITSVDGSASLKLIAPAASQNSNAWFVFQSSNSSEIPSLNNSYQTVDQTFFLTPDTNLISAWTTLSTGTVVTFTASGVDQRAGIIVELVAPMTVTPAAAPSAQGRHLRIPEVPAMIAGPIGTYLRQVVRQLNAEAFISRFSGTDPNTSGFTGIPGNLLVNVGSASTWTRLWMQIGSVASISTTSWHPLRVA